MKCPDLGDLLSSKKFEFGKKNDNRLCDVFWTLKQLLCLYLKLCS